MFQPPDPRIPAVAFTPRETKPSPVGWAVLAGILFAAVRFSIGVACILWMAVSKINEAQMDGIVETAWFANIAASFAAGLVGGVLFWRLRGQKPTKAQGAKVGIVAAFGSFAGNALGVASLIIVGISNGGGDILGPALGAVLMNLCGVGGATITGIVSIPVLVGLGAILASMQRQSS